MREALEEFGLAAIAELLEIRIRGIVLGGAPVVAGPKPSGRALVKVQLVQLILVALVVGVRPVAKPSPPATAKVTLTPLTGWWQASVTRTLGAVATAMPATAVWALPAFRAICVAGGTILNLKIFQALVLAWAKRDE